MSPSCKLLIYVHEKNEKSNTGCQLLQGLLREGICINVMESLARARKEGRNQTDAWHKTGKISI